MRRRASPPPRRYARINCDARLDVWLRLDVLRQASHGLEHLLRGRSRVRSEGVESESARLDSEMLSHPPQTHTSAFLIFFACLAMSSGPRLSMIRAADMVACCCPAKARALSCKQKEWRARAGGSHYLLFVLLWIVVSKLHL